MMKLEGVDEFAQAVGKAGKWLEKSGTGMRSTGKSITQFGLRLMGAGLLIGLVVLLAYWIL